jgi:nucleotide-binding universal stress UspA family protein
MFKHLLVAVDGSDHAEKAVDVAIELARRDDAQLTLMHVLTRSGSDSVPRDLTGFASVEQAPVSEHDMIERAGQQLLDTAEQKARAHGIAKCGTVLERGDAAARIVGCAEQTGADLIVMGRRGLGDFGALLRGSVSHKVAHASEICCLTVK